MPGDIEKTAVAIRLETPPSSATRNDDYRFLGNRFQLGVRVKRDPVELFVQFQDSLPDLPR